MAAPESERFADASGKGEPGRRQPGQAVEKVFRRGVEILRTTRDIAAEQFDPLAARERQMITDHQLAKSRYEVQVRQNRLRAGTNKVAAFAAGSLGALTALSIPMDGLVAGDFLLGGVAAGLGALAFRSARRSRALQAHPPVPALPPLPPARLRSGARGAKSAEHIRLNLLHLYEVIPQIAALYPQAGQELARVVNDVEPLLRGQVERLASLDRIEWDMPGSIPARAAAQGAQEVAARLDSGAAALEGLIAAAAHMLAAPDLVDGASEVLLPAIDSLQAYTHGLYQASRTKAAYPPLT
ncbi:MAG: hypothetical protein ACOYEV_06500 [Candidatus Nanopelagicales bacterium]